MLNKKLEKQQNPFGQNRRKAAPWDEIRGRALFLISLNAKRTAFTGTLIRQERHSENQCLTVKPNFIVSLILNPIRFTFVCALILKEIRAKILIYCECFFQTLLMPYGRSVRQKV
jgi:hypothetical protein